MTGRRTNVALLVLVPVALGTGLLGFAVGTPVVGSVVVAVHGGVGLTLVLLARRKTAIAQRGLHRKRTGRTASLALAGLVVLVVATGIMHAGGLRVLGAGITTMQVHVGAALLSIPLFGWHAWSRPARPQVQDLSRRSLLRTATVGTGAVVLWGAGEGLWRLAGTPGADRRFTGSHEVGSRRPESMPVTQWLFDSVPRIDPASWRLTVGRHDGEVMLGIGDLTPTETVDAVVDCTGGWWAVQEWGGIRLDHLVGPDGGAASVVVRSATGYWRRFAAGELSSLWLATHCAGLPLSAGHGAPARLVAPGRRGFWWVKWVVAIELDDEPPWRQPPFPLQ